LIRKGSTRVPQDAWVATAELRSVVQKMACHLRQASGAGETELYAIRGRGCVTQFTHGKVFHRQKRGFWNRCLIGGRFPIMERHQRQGGGYAVRTGGERRQSANHWPALTRPGWDAQVVTACLPLPPFPADEHTAPGNPPRRGPQLFGGECARREAVATSLGTAIATHRSPPSPG
jgi:hypothetical protein